MTFSPNQTTFPTATHKAIWNAARQVFPLEKSLPALTNESIKLACTDLYNFTMAWYEDVYNHPHIYGLNPEENDKRLAGRRWGRVIIAAELKEDADTIEFFRNAKKPLNFVGFLCNNFKSGSDTSISFTKSEYKKLLAKAEKSTGYDEGEFVELMERLSFELTAEAENDEYVITNKKYPRMFAALKMLRTVETMQKSAHKNPKSKACQYFDFRVLAQDYECSFEDALFSLDDTSKAYVLRMDELLTSLGVKKKYMLNRVDWKFKGKKIAECRGDKNHLDIGRSPNANNLFTVFIESWSYHFPWWPPGIGGGEKKVENKLAFEEAVNNLPNAEEMRRFCTKHTKRCSECGCRHARPPRGHPKTMFGKTFFTCGGGTDIGVEYLTPDNFNLVAALIKIRLDLLKMSKEALLKLADEYKRSGAEWNNRPAIIYDLASYDGKYVKMKFSSEAKRTNADGEMFWMIHTPDFPVFGNIIANPEPGEWYKMSGEWSGWIHGHDARIYLSKWGDSDKTRYTVRNFDIKIEEIYAVEYYKSQIMPGISADFVPAAPFAQGLHNDEIIDGINAFRNLLYDFHDKLAVSFSSYSEQQQDLFTKQVPILLALMGIHGKLEIQPRKEMTIYAADLLEPLKNDKKLSLKSISAKNLVQIFDFLSELGFYFEELNYSEKLDLSKVGQFYVSNENDENIIIGLKLLAQSTMNINSSTFLLHDAFMRCAYNPLASITPVDENETLEYVKTMLEYSKKIVPDSVSYHANN